MTVYWVAAAVALFYLMAAPVRTGALIQTDADEKFRFGVCFLFFRFMFGGRVEWGSEQGLTAVIRRGKKKQGRAIPISEWLRRARPAMDGAAAAVKAGRWLLRRIRLEKISVDARIATRDAARTALLYGVSVGALQAAIAAKPRLPIRGEIRADFGCEKGQARILGIVSIPMGHIIFAVLWAIAQFTYRRTSAWLNIRLNRS